MKKIFSCLLDLFYPPCCVICKEKLLSGEIHICLNCMLNLPRTNYHLQKENGITDRFMGRIPYEQATAFLFYNKEGLAQNIIASIKYQGDVALGFQMGELMAKEITKNSSFFESIDFLIPIPLNAKREKKRGYNQAEVITKGITKLTNIPIKKDVVIRKNKTQTQTRKGKFDRWKNMMDVFVSTHFEELKDKHLLIVDDVLTTGSTMESCIKSILEMNPDVKISILTLAVTE